MLSTTLILRLGSKRSGCRVKEMVMIDGTRFTSQTTKVSKFKKRILDKT